MKPIDKHFVSEIDKKLAEFNESNAKSPAQQAEIDKYEHIYKLRDHATVVEKDKDIWDLGEE